MVKHGLKLTGLNHDNANTIQSDIDAMPGVDHVRVNSDKGRITVAYDGSRQSIDELLAAARRHRADVGTGWWNRLKLGLDRQKDQTIRDNAAYRPSCCNKPPE